MILNIRCLFLVLTGLTLAACGGDNNTNSTSVYDVIRSSDSHTTLETAINTAGLADALDDKNASYTVFAPTDEAFDALGSNTVSSLLANPDELSDTLLYHVLDESRTASTLVMGVGEVLTMMNGDETVRGLESDDFYLNYSLVIQTDITADNGIVHVLDAVLLPPDLDASSNNIAEVAVADGRFETLVAALQSTGLDAVLADENERFTVFAPTDDAFAMLPTGTITALLSNTDALSALLLQHVLAGAVNSTTALTFDGMMVETASGSMIEIEVDFSAGILNVGGSNVVITDIVTSNGIIHVIDSVIVGNLDVPQPSIVDVAEEVGGFTTLLAALEETGLDAVLADLDESYTVFAPTDSAFAELGDEAISALLATPDDLSEILLYHVLGEATVLADSAISIAQSDNSIIETASGKSLGLSLNENNLYINTAVVSTSDVMASNGVIHVIDQVLSPPVTKGEPTANIVETAIAAGNFSTLISVLGETGLDTVLADEDGTFTVFAPTDAAFDLIPTETLDALVADVPALTEVLLQHVISNAEVDSITAFSLNGTSVDTAATGENSDVTIEIVDGSLQIQGANVSTYDIYTSNGVIHIIDAVITETLE